MNQPNYYNDLWSSLNDSNMLKLDITDKKEEPVTKQLENNYTSLDHKSDENIENDTSEDYLKISISSLSITSEISFQIEAMTNITQYGKQKLHCTYSATDLKDFINLFSQRKYNGFYIPTFSNEYIQKLSQFYTSNIEAELSTKNLEHKELQSRFISKINGLFGRLITSTMLDQLSYISDHPKLKYDHSLMRFLNNKMNKQEGLLKIVPTNAIKINNFGKSIRKSVIEMKNKHMTLDPETDSFYKKQGDYLKEMLKSDAKIQNCVTMAFKKLFTFTFNRVGYIKNFSLVMLKFYYREMPNLQKRLFTELSMNYELLYQDSTIFTFELIHNMYMLMHDLVSGLNNVLEKRQYEYCKIHEYIKRYEKATEQKGKSQIENILNSMKNDHHENFGVIGKEEIKSNMKKIEDKFCKTMMIYSHSMCMIFKDMDKQMNLICEKIEDIIKIKHVS